MPEINVVLKEIKYFPTTTVRQFYIKRYCGRTVLISKIEDFTKVCSNYHLQIHFMRFIYHDLGKPQIIFNYQHNLVGSVDIITVVTGFINDLVYSFQVSC